ncbi:helix-turn-helix transcriptional regulator [Streptomyces ziwulingensis]|uniref:helix-turn-helix domain-containing protein n=1 Tax=Streptomyces ziwulingensis TaxID=1045501 RepID=UPI0031E6073D
MLAQRRAVGDHIRCVREYANLSRLDVCSTSGVDVASYSRIENGHPSPRLDTLIRIADAIAVPPRDLVPGDGRPAIRGGAGTGMAATPN